MQSKICNGCKVDLPVEEYHAQYKNGKFVVRSKCAKCTNAQAHYNRQRIYRMALNKGEDIKTCECGNLFREINGSSKCKMCIPLRPMIKAYCPSHKRSLWVRLPEGYGRVEKC